MGKTPTDSSGNVKNEFNQVSSLFEEAIKIKGDHASTMLSSFSSSPVCLQLECIPHKNLPRANSPVRSCPRGLGPQRRFTGNLWLNLDTVNSTSPSTQGCSRRRHLPLGFVHTCRTFGAAVMGQHPGKPSAPPVTSCQWSIRKGSSLSVKLEQLTTNLINKVQYSG